MKVALMTFFIGQNYGALLQAWALWQLLSDLGYEVEFIDYHHPWSTKPNWWSWRSYISRSLSGVCRRIRDMGHHLQLRRQFRKMERLFPRSSVHYGANPMRLEDDPPIADVYVVGSDQVWRTFSNGYQYIRPYFLPFGTLATKRIAYAASLGGENFCDEARGELKVLLERFAAISVRENASVKRIAELTSQTVSVMPDPTLALGRKKFEVLRDKNASISKDMEVFYIMDGMSQQWTDLLQNMNSSHTYNIALQGFRMGKDHNFIPTVPQFIDVIAQSRFVVTNSFHACVFSILYHRPFVFIPFQGIENKRNERVKELLLNLGLMNQWADNAQINNLNKKILHKFEWCDVDKKLDYYHLKASTWIKDVIGR